MSELPKGWVEISISDVADVKGGKRLPKGGSFSEVETSYPYIRVSDFDNGTINTQKLKFIDRETHLAISNYVVSSDDLYISIAGTIGLVGDIPKTLDGANLTENAAKLCNLHVLNKDFLKYFLQSPSALQQFIDKTTSSGQPKLALFRIKDCSLGLAPLAEQKRIVEKLDEVLGQVDTIKARLDGIPDLLKRFRQSVLTSAVLGKLTEEWRGKRELIPNVLSSDFTTKKYGDVVDDEHYDNIPNSWGWVKFGSLVELINGDRGKNYPNKSEYVDEGIAFINTGHIDPDGTLSSKRMNYISEDKFSSLGSGKIQRNDLVYCLRGATMGKTAIVNPFEIGAIASSLVIVRPSESLFFKFAYYFLVSPQAKEQIQRFDNGSAQPNLSAKSLGMYPIGLPPFEEQKEIVRLVDQYFAFADTIEAQVKKAQARVDILTQSILAKAFRGELVDQDPNDEPADKLLERIAEARKEAEALAKAAKKARSTKSPAKKRAAKSA
ncbi:restriction endonuclease subunit S [Vibrio harveyi]|uniref:restriction endonuclease subunit S n=1 Tax=Vibrio harveyi TaxID=669 RepID=UPI003CEF046E